MSHLEAVAYRSTHPKVLEAWDDNQRALNTWSRDIQAFVIGEGLPSKEVYYNDLTGRVFIPLPDGGEAPKGWRIDQVGEDDCLVPDRRTREGKLLAERLEGLKMPDVRKLPGMPVMGIAAGGGHWAVVQVRRVEDVVYAYWSRPLREQRNPIDASLWEQIKLSEYFQGVERLEEAGRR